MDEMRKGIQSIHIKEPDLLSVYGFGSFFRSEDAADCDLLLVVKDDSQDLGSLHTNLSRRFSSLGKNFSIDFDLTILTERENKRKPLREYSKLVPLSVISE